METYVFDIETGPLPDDQLIMPDFNDPEEVKVGNLKDPAKIEAKRQEYRNRFLERAALSALSGQILALGILGPTKNDLLVFLDDEPAIIRIFFEKFIGDRKTLTRWVGFNVAGFDIPMIVRRAWHHRIPVPGGLFKGRYLSSWFVDLAEIWRCSAHEKELISLDRLARFLGLAGKDGNGAGFAALLYQEPKAAIEYLRRDLELTWQIAERFGALGALEEGQVKIPSPQELKPEPEPEPEEQELAFW
jgi:hypothetical protein